MTIPTPDGWTIPGVPGINRDTDGKGGQSTADWFTDTAKGAGGAFASAPGAVAGGLGNAVEDAVPGAASFATIAEAVGSPDFWKRILTGAAGLALIWVGIILLISTSTAGRKLTGAVITGASKGIVSGDSLTAKDA